MAKWLSWMETIWKPQIDGLGFDMTDPAVSQAWPGLVALFEGRGFDVTGIPLWGEFPEKIDRYEILYRDWESEVDQWDNMASVWVLPHEVIEEHGTFDDWQTVVSTGPWIPEDYVHDSSATYVRNPNYWQHDPSLPDFQLPYADKLVTLVILDGSTCIAALRTAGLIGAALVGAT